MERHPLRCRRRRRGGSAEPGRAQRRVDALVLTGCRTDTLALLPTEVLRRDGLGVPLVMLDGEPNDRLDASVRVDNRPGIEAAMGHFLRGGRRRIGFIGSAVGPPVRGDLYRDFLARHALDWSATSEVPFEESVCGGHSGAVLLRENYPDMDAVLVWENPASLSASCK